MYLPPPRLVGTGGQPIGDPRISGPYRYNPMQAQPNVGQPRILGQMKKGGKVKKTGNYKLHKGEKVIPAKKSMESNSSTYNFRDHMGKK